MKQMKVLTVFAALAMTLGLSACGGKKECKTHQWGTWETTKAATCQEEGSEKRVCKKCGKEQNRSVDKLEHQWQEVAGTRVEATCEEAGHYSRKCSLCQTQEDNVEIPALGHDWVDDEDQTAAVAPTCTTAGTRLQHCSHDASHTRTATVDALGHDWGEWEETKAPKCEEDGERKHTCQREGCGVEEKEVVAKLGHHLVAQADDGTAAKEDFAKVRVFECDREGCDYATFGFKATETSQNSGRLLEETVTNDKGEEEVGKRFWGRPIGNDVALDENGTADRDNHDPVYNPETQGDLFEYKFTLTPEQVAALGEDVACYADAKPADYLGGQDFWACDPNAEEWTPGYYIEGEKAGTAITDYRYILYVDGSPVEFDSSIKAPVSGNGTNLARGEFIMPYIFHFTAGDHSISLRMAGGYRSLFFNFIFKSYEAPEVPPEPENPWVEDTETVMPTPAADGALVKRYIQEGKDDVKYEIDVKTANMSVENDSDWKTNPSTGAFKLNNGKTATFKFDLPKAFEGKMYQSCYMDSYNSNKTKKMFYETNNHCNIEVKVNDNAIDFSQFSATTFQEVFGDELDGSNSLTKEVVLGDVVLKGANVVTYKRVETLNTIVNKFVFIGKDHVEKYDAVSTLLNSDNKPVTLSEEKVLGTKAIEIKFSDFSTAPVNPNGTNPWYMAKGSFAEWKISVDKDITGAKIYFSLEGSSNDHLNRHLFNEAIWDAENGTNYSNDDKKAGTPDKASEDAWRYSVAVGSTNFPLKNESRLNECGVTKTSTQTYVYFTDIDLAAGENVIKLTQNNIGYRMRFNQNVRIIFEGDAVITGTAA